MGRSVAGKWSCGLRGCGLVVASALRLVFLPLFLFCNVQINASGPPTVRHLPYLFQHDAFPLIFMLLFAISNGYIGTICMMHGPLAVRPTERKLAGTLMAFFLTFGLTVGAGTSFLLHALLCACNPFVS